MTILSRNRASGSTLAPAGRRDGVTDTSALYPPAHWRAQVLRLGLRWLPALDIGLALLAGAILYVRPRSGLWPLALIGLAWLLRLLIRGRLTRSTPLDLPLVAFVASAMLAASIAFNQRPEWGLGGEGSLNFTPVHWAWGKFAFLIAGVGLYYSVANLAEARHVRWLIRLFGGFGAVVAAYFIATNDWERTPTKFETLNWLGLSISRHLPRIATHHLMPNVAGGLVAMTLPFLVPVLREAGPRERWLWAPVVATALAGLVLSASRGAWASLVIVGLIWLVASAVPALRQTGRGYRPGMRMAIPLGLLAAAAVWLIVLAAPSIQLEPAAVVSSTTPDRAVQSRLDLLRGSWLIAQDYLFTGGGLGSFPMLYSINYLFIWVPFLPHGHNLFLDILVEQGLAGLLSFVWLLVCFGVFGLRALRSPAAVDEISEVTPTWRVRGIVAASLASTAVMVLHGLADDVPYGSRALLVMLLPPALGVALAPGCASRFRLPRMPTLAAVGLLAAVLCWQRAGILGAWYANLGALEHSQRQLANYDVVNQQYRGTHRRELAKAADKLNQALAFDPSQRTANERLGQIAFARRHYAQARDYFVTATRSADNPTDWWLLSRAYAALNRRDEACRVEARIAASGLAGAWLFHKSPCD